MALRHQPAAELLIHELSTRWGAEDTAAIVHAAERTAQKNKAKELTPDHLKTAEEYYRWMHGNQPKES